MPYNEKMASYHSYEKLIPHYETRRFEPSSIFSQHTRRPTIPSERTAKFQPARSLNEAAVRFKRRAAALMATPQHTLRSMAYLIFERKLISQQQCQREPRITQHRKSPLVNVEGNVTHLSERARVIFLMAVFKLAPERGKRVWR